MEFRILGSVGVWINGREVTLDGFKQRTVLTALLLAGGRVLSDSQLSTQLWGWNPPATMNAQIYTYVSRLRKYLGPNVEIVRQRPGYLMRTGNAWFDYAEFEHLTRISDRQLKAGDHMGAARHLREALALWRGPALANVTEFLADAELPALGEARMAALESRIEADLALGRHHQLVAELTGLVAEHPVRERFRAQLMTTLYRCDRQADALSVYQDGRRILAEELGIDPGTLLASTYQSILTGDPRLDPPRVPPRHQPAGAWSAGVWPAGAWSTNTWPAAVPAMLPPDIADFTGRDKEAGELRTLLAPRPAGTARAPARIQITGMAGSGKTALAVHVACSRRDGFPDGQLYADLGGARQPKDPFEVLGGFLRALGTDEAAIPADLDGRVQLYRSQLARRQVLVLLDNAGSDDQVRPLLPSGPECGTLVTSRAHLASLEGAHVVDLDPFSPDEALGLLTAIVGARRVAAEQAGAERIVELCGRLPLAVRIAGARLAAKRRWPLGWLAHRLANDGSRLDELRLSGIDVRTSIQASYAELTEPVRRAFRLLALLDVPNFPVWAVAAVLGVPESAGEEILETLIDARLLDVAWIDRNGRPRYRFHALVLLFARERAVREDTAETRRTALDRALLAWLSLAKQADRSLATRHLDAIIDTPSPARTGGRRSEYPDYPEYPDSPADDPMPWFESEEDALIGLFHQACASGLHTPAWELAHALTTFLDHRSLRDEWRHTRQRMTPVTRIPHARPQLATG